MIQQLTKLKRTTSKSLQKLIAAMVICLLFPASGFSLGLGGIKLNSTLDQKLDAKIELLSVSDKELDNILIKLASPAVYERMGIERSIQLEQLRFKVISENGKNFIHVTTPLAVSEPFLNFLVEVDWSTGRLLREFTVLLDPPVFLEDEGKSAVKSPEAELPPVLTTPAGATEVETSVAAIEEDDSDEAVEGQSVDEEITKILSAASEPVQETAIREEIAEAPVQNTSTSMVYEVKKNEILWRIANKLRPENITVEQMMLALQRENPTAFFGDNVSMLKAGAVLRIENTATLDDISAEQAVQEIERQHQQWLAYRKERQAKNAVAAESSNLTPVGGEDEKAVDTEASQVAVTDVSNEPLLKLVAPVDERLDSDSTASNAALEAAEEKINELNIELVMANEELEARRRENQDLVTRLNSLEEQMSAMQSLVQLKDAELAKLRSSDAVAGDEGQMLDPLKVEIPGEEAIDNTVTKVVGKDRSDRIKQLWEDPVTLATGVAAILLIALAIILLRRKSTKRKKIAAQREQAKEKTLDELFPDNNGQPNINLDEEREVITFNQPIDTAAFSASEMEDGLAPMTDISLEDTVFAETDEELLDPLSEADVYLTYEKFDKAEKLLKEAIAATPDRHELKLKLLEVYALSDNKDAFNNQLDELYAAINGEESHPLWKQAISIGESIAADNPLLTKAEDYTLQTTEEAASSEKDDSNVVSIDWKPDQVTEFEAKEHDTDILDTKIETTDIDDNFDPGLLDKLDADKARQPILEDAEPKAKKDEVKAKLSDDDLEKAMSSFTEDALELELAEDELAESDITVSDVFDKKPATKNPVKEASFGDTSFFLLSDEVGTKLDLARAYIEMGDQDGASDLLAEVLNEGNQKQKLEAKELMQKATA